MGQRLESACFEVEQKTYSICEIRSLASSIEATRMGLRPETSFSSPAEGNGGRKHEIEEGGKQNVCDE